MKNSPVVNAQKKARVRRRVGAKEKLRSRPKRALSAFVYFTLDRRILIKEREPTIDPKEIMRRMGTDWKQLSDRSVYDKRATDDKERFRMELAAMAPVAVEVPACE